MPFPDPTRLSARFASDPELSRCARFFTGAFRLGVGEQRFELRFEAGRFAGAGPAASPPGARDVEISAAPAEWDKLLAPVPPPFYQDPFGAALHHPVSLGGDPETLFAYYGVLRRVIEILRESRA
jgi:hypothetical protein